MKRFVSINPYHIVLFCFTLVMPVHADVYQRIDQSGVTHFTDQPIGGDYKLIFRTPKRGTTAYKKFLKNRATYLPVIKQQARLYDVDPALVMAVIHTESGYDAVVVSKAGAVGLMQLMPATAKRFGVIDRENPLQNVAGGTQYLHYLLRLFKFDLKLSLAAYNAGENAVKKYNNKIPPYPETQQYVKRVLANYQNYLKDSQFL